MSHIPVPEINKRDRDDATEALIREALEEEQQRKQAKKGEATGECWRLIFCFQLRGACCGLLAN